jgi:hypothetical protein
LEDTLLWAFFLVTEGAHIFGCFFSTVKKFFINFDKITRWVTFWAIFPQIHLVTLVRASSFSRTLSRSLIAITAEVSEDRGRRSGLVFRYDFFEKMMEEDYAQIIGTGSRVAVFFLVHM